MPVTLKTVFFDTGTGNKRRVINGTDKSYNLECACSVQIIRSITITDTLLIILEEFVHCLYRNKEYKNINKLRFDLFSQKYSPSIAFSLSNNQCVNLSLYHSCKMQGCMHALKFANYSSGTWVEVGE